MSEASPQHRAADPDTSAFVTANAGSGKTTTLVNRVARLLLRRVDPETILCITFTKAAAAEMQRRLFDQLGEWALADDAGLVKKLTELEDRPASDYDKQALSRARALFAQALETPGGLKIQTIHAFCEKLLRRFPLEAGIAPGFQVLDDVSAAAVAAEARDEIARRAMAGEEMLSEAYARFAVALPFKEFEAMFATFEARREQILAWVAEIGGKERIDEAVHLVCGLPGPVDPERIEENAANLPAFPRELWMKVADVLDHGAARDKGNAAKMRCICEVAATPGGASFKDVVGVFCTSEGKVATWVDTAAALRKSPALHAQWLEERDRVFAEREIARRGRIAKDTFHALTLADFYAQAYAQAKQRRGALDFTDLVQRTLELLAGSAAAQWVLFKLDAGLEHILVDEAQDTAPEQWGVVDALTEEFFAGLDGKARLVERSLFVVGDEKQSIFSFQGAAPDRLRAAVAQYRQRIDAAGRRFETVPLDASWRSTVEVLAFVDAVFTGPALTAALTSRDDAGPVRHLAKRDDGRGTVDLWELEREEAGEVREAWDEPLDAGQRRGAWRRLAERIARETRAIVERGEAVHDKKTRTWRAADYGDVLVLVRKRGALFEEVLRALKREGVPVAGADRLVLSEHPVFEDLVALARFIRFPGDDLSLAGVLRSPLADLDETSLYDLAQDRTGSLWSALVRRGDERPEWREARRLLGWAIEESAARPPFDFFSRLMTRLDGRGLSQRERFVTRLGSEAADAIEEFLAQALAAESRGVHDLERLVDQLSRLSVSIKRELDEPRGEVRVMTAHGAKGLESAIVFMPDTVGAGHSRGSALLETADGGFLWCRSESEDCDASALARAARKKREENEAARLLYVGLTRARDRLILAGRINARDKEENLKTGWWPVIRNAFTSGQLPEEPRTVETPEGPVTRFGADPKLAERAAAAAAEAPASPPAWTRQPVPEEPAGAVYASPSTLLEDVRSPSPSPLSMEGGLGRFRRGTLIHRLLQLLPDLAAERRADAAARLLAKEPGLSETQRAEMAAAALAVLDDPVFAEVFGPGSRAEAAVAGTAPDLPAGLAISGRVDRMRVTPERVLVVDFKTNRPAPARIEEADAAYVLQMAVYAAVLRAVFPGRRVEAALVWTDGPRLMPVPEPLMVQALQKIGQTAVKIS